jgi:hypothetical protein
MLSTCLCFQGLIASWYHQDRTVTIHFFAWLGLALNQEFRLLFLMLNSCASNTTSAMAKHFDRQSFVLFICQFDWFLIILLLLLGNRPFFFPHRYAAVFKPAMTMQKSGQLWTVLPVGEGKHSISFTSLVACDCLIAPTSSECWPQYG